MNSWTISYLVLIFVLVAGRFLLVRFMEASNVKVRFALGIGISLVYAVVLQLFFYVMYYDTLIRGGGIEEYYSAVAVGAAGISLVALFIAIVYFMLRSKRKISPMDKMKLEDL